MRAFILAAFSLVLCCPTTAQYWEDAGIEVDFIGQNFLVVDTTDNTLYCVGMLVQDWAQPEQSYRYAALHDGEWSLGEPLDHYSATLANYHDTLFMGGAFTYINGVFTSSVVYRANGEWHSAGNFNAFVTTLKVVDGELYALGAFTTVNGAPCKGLAKRNGSGWECMGLDCNTCYAYDIVEYQDRLIVSGTLTWPGYLHIVQLVDGQWEPVGPNGILGGLSAGGPMVIYHDDLYLGGLIHQSAGNAGHALMRWDGTAWHQVGEGLQDASGTGSQSFKAQDLVVHDDKLFVCGGFTYAGHVYSPRIATWDGEQWCSVGGDFGESGGCWGMAFYNDTLYISLSSDSLDGQLMHGVAKFIASDYENNCSGSVGVSGNESMPEMSIAYLGGDRFVVRGAIRSGPLVVYGSMGQIVATRYVQSEAPFELSELATGVYIARLANGAYQRFVKE